jgi:N-acetylmuramic acid 6-phosphate etherase
MNITFTGTEGTLRHQTPIDKLSIDDALKLMLSNQGEVVKVIDNNLKKIRNIIQLIFLQLNKSGDSRLIYAGAGTSARIGVQDGVELYPTFGWPISRVDFLIAGGVKALTQPVEGAEDDISLAVKDITDKKINANDVVIGLAASANTPYTVHAIKKSKCLGALTIGIGNNENGQLQKNADHSITLNTGPEIISGSTRLKAGTAQKICLNLISTMVMVKMGFVKNGLMINLIPSNVKLKRRKSNIEKMLFI